MLPRASSVEKLRECPEQCAARLHSRRVGRVNDEDAPVHLGVIAAPYLPDVFASAEVIQVNLVVLRLHLLAAARVFGNSGLKATQSGAFGADNQTHVLKPHVGVVFVGSSPRRAASSVVLPALSRPVSTCAPGCHWTCPHKSMIACMAKAAE